MAPTIWPDTSWTGRALKTISLQSPPRLIRRHSKDEACPIHFLLSWHCSLNHSCDQRRVDLHQSPAYSHVNGFRPSGDLQLFQNMCDMHFDRGLADVK